MGWNFCKKRAQRKRETERSLARISTEILAPVGRQLTREAPVIRIYLLDDDMNVLRLLTESVHQSRSELLDDLLFLLPSDSVFRDLKVDIRHTRASMIAR